MSRIRAPDKKVYPPAKMKCRAKYINFGQIKLIKKIISQKGI